MGKITYKCPLFLVEFNPNVEFYFSLNLIKTNEHLKNVFVQLALMNLRR